MTLLFTLFLLFQGPSPSDTLDYRTQAAAYLEQGWAAEQEGRYLEALQHWRGAKDQLAVPDLAIAREYIRLATQQGADSLYPAASEMYFWGLSAGRVEENRPALEREVEFLEPLATDEELRSWRSALSGNDASIFSRLRGFWNRLDPTLTTAHNERLIEHWERIAHARRHFTKGNKTAWGTDPRGEIYLRYGEPDLKRSGHLLFNSSTAEAIVRQAIEADVGTLRFDSVLRNFPGSFVRMAQQMHAHPEYDIWIYRNLHSDNPEPTLFIFGTEAATGAYSLVQSIEDFIPDDAFSVGGRQTVTASGIKDHRLLDSYPAVKNLRVGVVLQLMYYDQLSTADPFFGEMYRLISSRLRDNTAISPSLGQEMLTKAQLELNDSRLRSPREISAVADVMREIPLEVYQYRVLGTDGKPYLATFFQSEPQEAFLIDYLYNYDSSTAAGTDRISGSIREAARGEMDNYRLVHQIRIFDEQWNPGAVSGKEAAIPVESGRRSHTVHYIPHSASGTYQLFGAELHNTDPYSTFQGSSASFPPELRGTGKRQSEQPEPLDTNPSSLEMADLILGFDRDENAAEDDPWPFTIAHDREIPAGEELILHLETYHLQQDENGIANFSLSYQILKPNRFMTWLRGDYRTSLELTLNLQADEPDYRENLQIRTREMEPGTYLLRVRSVDHSSGQSTERELEFRVVDR